LVLIQVNTDRYIKVTSVLSSLLCKPIIEQDTISPSLLFPPACGGKVKGYFSFVKLVVPHPLLLVTCHLLLATCFYELVAIPSFFLALDGKGLR
jgi:hypothetical protein